MTEKQYNFIQVLLKERDYDFNNLEVKAVRAGIDLPTNQASELIGYLLSCDKLQTVSTDIKKIQNALYKVAKNKKTPKNQTKLWECSRTLNKSISKSTVLDLSAEELNKIAHIVL